MLTSKVLRGTAILFAGRFGSQLLGLASTVVAARLLLPEDFGLVAIALSVFAISGAVIELPVATALVQIKEARKADFDTAWTLNVIRGLIVSVLMLAAAWPVAQLFNDPRLAELICFMALYPAIIGFRNSYFEQYIRDLNFKWEAFVELGTKLASLLTVVLVAWLTGSYWALAFGLIASGAVAVIMSFALRPQLPSLSLREFRKFFGFSVWLGLEQLLDNLWSAVTTLLIGRVLGNAVLGAHSVASQFGERLAALLFAPVERTLFAAFSSIQEQVERIQNAYLQSLRLCAAVVLPVCAGISLLASTVVAILFGPNFALAATILAFVAPSVALLVLTAPGFSLAIALGRTRRVFEVRLLGLAIYIPMLAAGLYWGGLIGALWAGIVGQAVLWLLSLQLISSVLGVSVQRQLKTMGRSAMSCAAMVAVALPARALLLEPQEHVDARLLLNSAGIALAGAATYVSFHLGSWHLSGRPAGFERFCLDLWANRSETPAAAIRPEVL